MGLAAPAPSGLIGVELAGGGAAGDWPLVQPPIRVRGADWGGVSLGEGQQEVGRVRGA